MAREKVHLTKEKETLLATLYGKALDSRSPEPILGDDLAREVVERIDYDFAALKLPRGAAVSLPVRAKHFDGWTREYIADVRACTVLHLGCGLDSRVFRVDPPPSVRWVDIDYPDVIDLRRRLFPPREGYELVGTSVTAPGWVDRIPADGPVLVVAEGLVHYLPPGDLVALLGRVVRRFPAGQIVFDAYSRTMIRMVKLMPALKRMGAVVQVGVDDARQLEARVPGLELVTEVPFLALPELVVNLSRTQSRVEHRLYAALARTAFLRNAVRHLRYRFPATAGGGSTSER
jgi:O-methyltransferase involved in polyketide biosynthesis